ncbi:MULTISPECIES: Bax inhibitor-1/YccA family protein [Spongiibacter]|uniref:Bax inhibitor-1/YccA family protein n=1 Tax=Spongiibacter TaxID=630749 RepID=UPI000C364842|nr:MULTISPECIES: Bax inhibitor-1/YccA family protein [Spongiibacter]MBO6751722.1 Bax inhibitor-1/YccA family protein [Spongiibacter sp.]MBU70842.1 BAX inhibitor protein [Spongiibacter sp.]|tara:strand:+ start:21139 stop:21807 length:669 start_codon:yes stop_codon:yes gene_type:complete
MQDKPVFQTNAATAPAVEINKVLRNTYMLLGLTLLNSALFAGVAMAMDLGRGAALGLMLGSLVMLFVVNATANSGKGLIATFVFTAMMGASLGPMLQAYLALPNGPSLVMQALGGTAIVFFSLSAYALTTRKDFSFMGGFLMVGLLVIVGASIANLFFQVAAVSLAISAAAVFIMSALILFDTSRIIHGGETNYIRATVALYLDIYNLFVHLLSLLGVFSDD